MAAPDAPPPGRHTAAPGLGTARPRTRAQTNVDFLVGVAVFLVVVGFVTSAATGMVTPFTEDRSAPVVADRVADEVVTVQITAPGSPAALDPDCTRAFFGSASASGCPFDGTASLAERTGVSPVHDLNVTVERNTPGAGTPILCLDATGAVQSCGAGGTRLAAGDDPPVDAQRVVTTTRVVHRNGTDVTVVVRVW